MEKTWPVPASYSKKVPKSGTQGAFWEYRKDRHHCGVDIYAPEGSPVLSVANGRVVETGEFSSPEILPYWNQTYYVLIRNQDGVFCKYAELAGVQVVVGESVKAGQILGRVGQVLNCQKVGANSPQYIQELINGQQASMLHFELYAAIRMDCPNYLGGNWFKNRKPNGLLDPTGYLDIVQESKVKPKKTRKR
jgi:murein DD-endopeptidase MepM/ murein hydrolase activator NlpD